MLPTFNDQRIRLTKTVVEKIPFDISRSVIYRDPELPGFGLRVGKTSKSYFVEGRVKGTNRRKVIGSHILYTPESARREAKRILLEMSQGKNPCQKDDVALAEITVAKAFEDYIGSRSLKATTLHDYEHIKTKDFASWLKKPIVEITKNMIERKHADLGKKSHARANNAMRVLRAVFNYAIAKYEDSDGSNVLLVNPVTRLSKTRTWFKIQRRQTVIRAHQLGAWINGVLDLPNTVRRKDAAIIRDYLLLLAFTGLRKSEAAKLAWSDIDLAGKSVTVKDTKNHDDHTLPLPDFLVAMLQERRKAVSGDFLFPGTANADCIVDPRKQMAHITKATNITFTLHDLRRTFITVAESLDIPAYALKRLLNHRMTNDVTAGYIIADPERLREPMERICKFMLEKAGLTTEQAIERLKVGVEPRTNSMLIG